MEYPLYVMKQTSTGFTVQADRAAALATGKKDGDLTGKFSWRVVATRKDIAGARLAPATMPPEPTLPDLPPRSGAARREPRPGSDPGLTPAVNFLLQLLTSTSYFQLPTSQLQTSNVRLQTFTAAPCHRVVLPVFCSSRLSSMISTLSDEVPSR